ncbi:ER membrane protein complex subunit 2 [Vitis vinifera]|uniref:ER membrane protein complex subunit 2 n=1 Tax=Vitis vinifera TaxID=29760 RepID=A0A438BQ18_VITVI|nr:ER membrane protein complex subunit 2 [Vitis vinifera]
MLKLMFWHEITGRLEGMLLESKGSWAEAEKAYSSLLEENPFDQVVLKRRVAMAKAQGDMSGAIEWLNKYLETFMADHDAWRELAEIYVSLQMYKQAAYCYEELILSQPTLPLYHLAYAEVSGNSTSGSFSVSTVKWKIISEADSSRIHLYTTTKQRNPLHESPMNPNFLCWKDTGFSWLQKRIVLYTLGGLENLQTAKKYYASTIDLTGGKNTRALFGICLCTAAIGQLTKGRNKEEKESPELHSLAATALEKIYKQRAPTKLPLLNSALKGLKI